MPIFEYTLVVRTINDTEDDAARQRQQLVDLMIGSGDFDGVIMEADLHEVDDDWEDEFYEA